MPASLFQGLFEPVHLVMVLIILFVYLRPKATATYAANWRGSGVIQPRTKEAASSRATVLDLRVRLKAFGHGEVLKRDSLKNIGIPKHLYRVEYFNTC